MTLNELAYELRMLLRNNKLSDDDALSNRLLERWIVSQRALWAKQQLAKRTYNPSKLVQDLGCVKIGLVDAADCCGFDVDCSAIRTTVEIPRSITTLTGDGITRVGPINKLLDEYQYVPYERALVVGAGYFNKNAIVSFRLDDYVYIISKSDEDYFKYLEYINIRGIFEDPRTASDFTYCSGDSCFSEDSDYPLGEDLWVYMKSEIVKGNFGIMSSVLSDKANDATAKEIDK